MAKDKQDDDQAPDDPDADRFVLDSLSGLEIGGVQLSDELDDGDSEEEEGTEE